MSPKMTREQRDLIVANRGLAERIAHDFLASAPGLDIEELVAVAYQGLTSAAIAFDASLGYDDKHFAGYARLRIRGAIIQWQRDEDYLERYVRRDFKNLVRAGYQPGRAFDETDLSEKTGLSVKRIRTVIRAQSVDPTSIDAIPEASDTIADPETSVETSVVLAAIQGSVAGVVKSLPMLQQVVLAMHYFEGKDHRQIAEAIGVSPQTVKVAHSEAVLLVHQAMSAQARAGS